MLGYGNVHQGTKISSKGPIHKGSAIKKSLMSNTAKKRPIITSKKTSGTNPSHATIVTSRVKSTFPHYITEMHPPEVHASKTFVVNKYQNLSH